MSIELRLPNIQGGTAAEQMAQMKSYMYQLVEQLNWALNTVESAQSGNASAPVAYQGSKPSTAQEAEETFNSIKALIIKSADIVKAYEETIRTDFDGYYVAESDFGTYTEKTNLAILENSRGIEEVYTSVQTITNADGTGSMDVLDGYIKRGILSDGSLGVEIGETVDGNYKKFARFTAERLTFFDINGNPVAYIGAGDSDTGNTNCLYVTGKAVFLGEIQLGGYKTDTSDGLAFTWIG